MAQRAGRDRSEGGSRRMSVVVGIDRYPLKGCDSDGFEIALDMAPRLPGHVALHEGGRLVRNALIVAEGVQGDAMRYAFKRSSLPRSSAPLDYALAD